MTQDRTPLEGDVPEDTLTTRSNLRLVLAGLPIFASLPAEGVEALAADCEWLSLPGGWALFEAGEAPDALYVVISGCFGSFAPPGTERRRFLGRVLSGESVGEMGLLTGRPRTASVIALRDSEVVRVSRTAFERICTRYPQALLGIAQLTVARLESSTSGGTRGRPNAPRTFALLPQSIEVDIAGFATQLVAALAKFGRAELVWSVRGAEHTSHWFHKLETQNDFVVYAAEQTSTPWTKLCMRQADALLLVANADSPPGEWPSLTDTQDARMATQRAELILLHDERVRSGMAAGWRAKVAEVPHHHVADDGDVRRLARLLTGRAVGLVLSGGGARGFAHLGVVRALREAGIPIDMVGGTSIGAIMGAAVALGVPDTQLIEMFRRTFVDSNPLGDYTLPIYSLVAGRRVRQRLRAEFGDLAIEDIPIPYYCVSANLTTGAASVHRSGELWRWLRASVAIPGVLPPVMHRGEVFVDGATINNLPVDVMREMGRGRVIGVDVGADRTFTTDIEDTEAPPFWKLLNMLRPGGRRPNIFQVLWRSGMINSATATAARREQTDLLLQPKLENVDLLNWRAFQQAIDAGYAHAQERLAAADRAAFGV